MLGKKPLTRNSLLKMLDKTENAELKRNLESDPKIMNAVIEILLAVDQHFDSAEDAQSALDVYANKKSTSPSVVGA